MHGHLTAVVCYVIFSHMMKNRGQHGANNLDHFQQDIKTANCFAESLTSGGGSYNFEQVDVNVFLLN